MTAHHNHPLHVAIDAKLAQVVAASAQAPSWHTAWTHLGPNPTEEQRLAIYQAVRDAGSLPEEAGFYLVAWQIDALSLGQADESLWAHEERLEAIRQEHGLEVDECWSLGEGPPEYEEAQRELHAAWDALYAAKLEEYGEPDMAQLLRTDRERFEQLSEAGRRFFHGPLADEEAEEPAWLERLWEEVAGCIEVYSPMGPLGLRYREEEGFWEVYIYPTPVELVGGAHDGAVVAPDFTIDLEQLRSVFEKVTACGWNALGTNCPEGPYVYVEGVYDGHEVYLQLLANAPEDEEPGIKVDTNRRPGRRE